MEAMEGMAVARRTRQERAWTLAGAARAARDARIATVRFLQTPASQVWEMGKLLTAYQMHLAHCCRSARRVTVAEAAA